jgi:hypothetical protein
MIGPSQNQFSSLNACLYALESSIETVAVVFLGIVLHASTSGAEDKSKSVKYLLYYNAGGYTVDYVQLFWENDGVQQHKSGDWCI